MSVSSSLKCTTNPPPEVLLALLHCLGQGLSPPYSLPRRNAPADQSQEPYSWYYHVPLGCQKHRIILWALVCPHPGYICMHHFASPLPISIRMTTINCNRAQNKHDSQFFSPLAECFEKLNLLCQARGHQWDFMRLSELPWEMCQQGYICFSAADGEGWPAWPHPINGQTIINVHEAALYVICDQQHI